MNDEHKTSESNNHTETAPTSKTPETINLSPTQPAIEDQLQQAKKEMSGFERGMLIATIAAVIVSCIYAFLAFRQMLVMESQLAQMSNSGVQTDNLIQQAIAQANAANTTADSTKKIADRTLAQAEATNKLAQESKRTADIAEKALKINSAQSKAALDHSVASSRLDQRAWLGVGKFRITQFEKDKPFKAEIEIINSGKTPAINVEEGFKFGWLAQGYYDPSNVRDDIRNKEMFEKWFSNFDYAPAQSVPPQGIFYLLPEDKLFASLYEDVKAKKLIIYIVGEIKYTDIFGMPCSTKICLWMDNPEKPILMFCKKYNDLK